ncbi:MAG TPA: YcbK family protein [Vicinamibacteria bacterium]|nr:YcbK family protein [Vicinamibacteria bacterium]
MRAEIVFPNSLTGTATTRRGFVKHAALAAAGAFLSRRAHAESRRSLAFYNLHTGESLRVDYWSEGTYTAGALHDIDHILRDYRTGGVKEIDIRLLDLLHRLTGTLGSSEPYQVISGYRSAATNASLRAGSDGVARHSLHVDGRAIDVRLPGVRLEDLHRAALAQRGGGVGYYPSSAFVHVDTGRVRAW